uniref:Receptor-like serine/threonine-protein kinase n=1 Tax=Brassica oleracea var. oleracea TaxID=109376 RepID=A0A0D3BCW1_BRAOL
MCTILAFLTLSLLLGESCCQTDTLLQGQSLKDGQELVSAFNIFKLKFFNFKNSRKLYLGVWYNNLYLNYVQDRPVWIANRDNPIPRRPGSLMIDSLGRLKILRGGASSLLLNLSSTESTGNTTLKLLDSGNLQLTEMGPGGSTRVLWQSFDYPTDTLLPGMKLGFNVKTKKRWELRSGLSDTLPASGSFVFGMDANISNLLTILWRGKRFLRINRLDRELAHVRCSPFTLTKEVSSRDRHRQDYSGRYEKEYRDWYEKESRDGYTDQYEREYSDQYGGKPRAWYEKNSSDCYGNKSRDCLQAGCTVPDMAHGFLNCNPFRSTYFEKAGPALPGSGSVLNETGGRLSSADCHVICLQNCSCVAYASTNVDGMGCEIWTDPCKLWYTDPTNNRSSSSPTSRSIYIREQGPTCMESDSGNNYPGFGGDRDNGNPVVWLIVGASLFLTILVIGFIIYKYKVKVNGFIGRRLLTLRYGSAVDRELLLRELGIDRRGRHRRSARKNNNELNIFSFESVALATDYFSDENLLGEGGFGPVYKGMLISGEEVAIKRLSMASGQGLVEFKNEAMLIAKLQHTNLVQLLGCCIEKDEKMLIYEYMPNKGLDYFLFDPLRKNVLDWRLRFRIMEGIIQGLLYLHKYSRLKVIHRDIKASNILLDEDMNPKISDFGMARIFGAQESKANTRRVAGTFGYMCPEYFREGLFSAKSDVFSFGVLMLEIICGRKNNSFHRDSEGPLNLIVHVWNLFKENRVGEVIDPSLGDSALENPQVLRCFQVALLCVQLKPEDRPSMLDVVSMIYGDGNNALSLPKEPAFYDGPRKSSPEMEVEQPESENASVNRVSITVMEAR